MKNYQEDFMWRNSSLIKEYYPKIKAIEFEMNYVDPDSLTAPSYKKHTLDPDKKAYFHFNCPYRECVDGGHDLSSIVQRMYDECIREESGELVCRGWQDETRINKHRCLCELNYKVIIDYYE